MKPAPWTKTPRLPIYCRNTKPRLRRWSAWLADKRLEIEFLKGALKNAPRPPRHGVHVFSASVSVMCLAPNLIEAAAGERSAIELPEHHLERDEDRRNIGQHGPPA